MKHVKVEVPTRQDLRRTETAANSNCAASHMAGVYDVHIYVDEKRIALQEWAAPLVLIVSHGKSWLSKPFDAGGRSSLNE